MEEFVAHYSRWRLGLLLLASAGLVSLGLWGIGAFGEVPSSRRYSEDITVGIGWLCILFFSVCGLAIGRRFFDSTAPLRIGPSGIRWARWSNQFIPWSEIINVTTWRHRHQKFIILHLSDADRFPGRGLTAKLAGANRLFTGGDISISLAATDRSYDDAMEAIAHFGSAADRSS